MIIIVAIIIINTSTADGNNIKPFGLVVVKYKLVIQYLITFILCILYKLFNNQRINQLKIENFALKITLYAFH